MHVWRQCALGIEFLSQLPSWFVNCLVWNTIGWEYASKFCSLLGYLSVSYERGRPFGKEVGNQNWALFVKLKFLFKGHRDTLINQRRLTTSIIKHHFSLKQESLQMSLHMWLIKTDTSNWWYAMLNRVLSCFKNSNKKLQSQDWTTCLNLQIKEFECSCVRTWWHVS